MEGPIYLVDMSFEYIEHSDIKAEENFFNENTHLGRYIKYPIFGAPFPPWVVGEKMVKYLANGPIWVAGASFLSLPPNPEAHTSVHPQSAKC